VSKQSTFGERIREGAACTWRSCIVSVDLPMYCDMRLTRVVVPTWRWRSLISRHAQAPNSAETKSTRLW
jgi:hypothetical protein